MSPHPAAIAFGFVFALIAGGGFLSSSPAKGLAAGLERAVLGATVGLPLVGVAVFFFSVSGIPVSALSVGLAAAGWRIAATRIRRASGPTEVPPPRARASRLSGLTLLLAGAVSLAKMVRVPLWSWDQFAIWGANARRWTLEPQAQAPIRYFRFHLLFQNYLSGLPVLWRGLDLGARPSPWDIKACHVVFALMLLVAARRAIGTASGSATVGNVLTAWLAASPLFWDTEAVGLADLPLALFATVALVFLPGRARTAAGLPFWISLAALPWIKNEGLAIAAAILAASSLRASPGAERLRRIASSAVGFVLVIGVAAAGRFFQSGETPTFLQGDWAGRVAARVPAVPHLLWRMAVELLRPGWLGVWLAAAVLFSATTLRRGGRANPLWLVVLVPFAADFGVYLATYLQPEAHIASSFGRISGALLPAVLVAVGAALAGSEPGSERNLPVAAPS